MKHLKLLIIILFFLSPTFVKAQWYIGADAGFNLGSNLEFNGNGTPIDIKRDGMGISSAMQIGYDFNSYKLEFEGGYQKIFTGTSIEETGYTRNSNDAEVVSFMTNGIYEFIPKSNWHPFVGIGIGAAYVNHDSKQKNTEVNDWSFAYQGMAGVSYDINKELSIKAQYKYFSTAGDINVKSLGNYVSMDNLNNHSILLGFTYKFKNN